MKNAWYRSPKAKWTSPLFWWLWKKVKTVKQRFTKDYSASSEAAKMLQQLQPLTVLSRNIRAQRGLAVGSSFGWFRRFASYGSNFRCRLGLRSENYDIETATADRLTHKNSESFQERIARDKTLTKEMKKHTTGYWELIKQAVTVRGVPQILVCNRGSKSTNGSCYADWAITPTGSDLVTQLIQHGIRCRHPYRNFDLLSNDCSCLVTVFTNRKCFHRLQKKEWTLVQ